MNRSRLLNLSCAVALLILSGTGCSKAVTYEQWQQAVQEYVLTSAGGDPNRLRDLSLGVRGSDHRGFALNASESPGQSTDARGVLLGMKEFGGKPKMVFLVGLVKKHSVQDIRMAAMAFDGKDFDWAWGAPDSAALSQYRAARAAAWKQGSGTNARLPAAFRSFPGVDDVFRLNAADGRLTATHVGSGTTWTLAPPGNK